ncbi:MAG TPA: TonB-dependent receptor [Brumimicrobium sp.]|nr:TonB-dependent receptor [Brumimicrobium sp.]
MKKFLLLFLLAISFSSIGQITQTLKGSVIDAELQFPLVGARLTLISTDSSVVLNSASDSYGLYYFNEVPIGKYSLVASYTSYLRTEQTVEINSGKESVVNVELHEDIMTAEEVSVVGRKQGEVNNEMATVSARQFSVEETNRYAGSRGDPARMASNFAGVQGADDSRNDIVVRGNSPIGLLWKVEGVDMPNPNHFATSGSTGGPVAILNNKILANSDFFMSAFPADYGNSISAVFDLKLRNGNTDRHEFTGQFGFLGTEVMAEGPISREKRSSYLVMARYSTLSIFQAMNIRIGTDAVPTYGDGAFKLNFPLKNGGHIGVFGIGGASTIDIMISEQKEFTEEAFGEGDRDQYFRTSMAIAGVTYKQPLSQKTFFRATVAQSYDNQNSHHNFLIRGVDTLYSDGTPSYQFRTDSIYPLMGYVFETYKTSLYASVNHKFNKNHILRAGINLDGYYIAMNDTALDVTHTYFQQRFDYKGFSGMVQPFLQYKWKVNDKMDFTAGLHSQYFSLSNSWSYAEPRLGWQYNMNGGHILTAGAGMHSQSQPLYQYTYLQQDEVGDLRAINKNMDFIRSIHNAIGYQKNFKNALSVKGEVYYQYLYNIPVEITPTAFSMINQGAGFQRFYPTKLVNEGTGQNYGVEVTVQKHFDKSFFFLVTGSLFQAKYKGSDGIERDTDFNGNYAANALVGKEFKINAKSMISAGLKFTAAGGRRYGYVDVEQSEIQHELVYKDSLFNTRQFKDYLRLDLKITYRYNAKKVTHEIGLDLVNILNTKNILALSYAPSLTDPSKEPIAERYQLGFLPIFYYKIDFFLTKKN